MTPARSCGAAARPVLPLLAAVLLAGCASGSPGGPLAQLFGDAPAPAKTAAAPAPAPRLDPVLAFVAAAKAGDDSAVADPATGRTVRVTAGSAYHAASGRLCRRYRVSAADASGTHARLACRGADGTWENVQILVNPDSLDGPSRLLHFKPRAS